MISLLPLKDRKRQTRTIKENKTCTCEGMILNVSKYYCALISILIASVIAVIMYHNRIAQNEPERSIYVYSGLERSKYVYYEDIPVTNIR